MIHSHHERQRGCAKKEIVSPESPGGRGEGGQGGSLGVHRQRIGSNKKLEVIVTLDAMSVYNSFYKATRLRHKSLCFLIPQM